MNLKNWVKMKGAVAAGISLLAGWLLLKDAKIFAAGIAEGLTLCAGVIIPALFPFMVLAKFVCGSGAARVLSKLLSPLTMRIFNLPQNMGSMILMSLIGGYPAAARMIGQEVKNGNLPAKTGERMLCFCVNAGPSFLVGAVGIGMLGSLKAGMILYFSQAISSLLMGFLLSFQEKRRKIDGNVGVSTETYSKVFVESVVDSVQAIISMCAFVLLFCAVLAFCESSGLFVAAVEFLAKVFSVSEEKIQAFFTGMIEVTAGSRAVARYGSLPMLAFITSFGSLSVIFQIYGQLVGSGMKLSGFTLSRVVHGVVAAVICRGMIRIFPEAAETMAQGAEAAITSTSAVGSAAVLIVTAMFLLTVGRGQQ